VLLLALAGALLAAAFLQRHRFGLVLGSALQVGVVATGLLTGGMYVVGGLFALVWIYLLRLRRDLTRRSPTSPPA
jgi:hypothetical protein